MNEISNVFRGPYFLRDGDTLNRSFILKKKKIEVETESKINMAPGIRCALIF